jgi:hypothetical protein
MNARALSSGAIRLVVIGDVVDCVLEDASVVSHPEKVIQLQHRHRVVAVLEGPSGG